MTDSEEIASEHEDRFNSGQFMDSNNIQWPVPPVPCPLGATDVHVWAAALDSQAETLAGLKTILSDEERSRADRFHFERHRNRFIAGRGILRSLLANYLDCEPGSLQFDYGPNGKPVLAGRFAESDLNFNLAHSENLALIAATRLGPVGVDVEKIRPVNDSDELVERFFSPRESALFQTVADSQKESAFFNLWTRKEAWLKATGEGIGHLLSRVEVTFLAGEPARFIALPELSGASTDWTLCELAPAPGFVGAIAFPHVQFSLSCFQHSNS